MRLALASLACCFAAAGAQYLSEGWKPGQAATPTREAAAPAFTPGAQHAGGEGAPAAPPGFLDTLLAKVGLNMSAAGTTYADLWDMRVPLIHDDNYEEVIVNEPLTPEEEADRVWFLVMYVVLLSFLLDHRS